LFSALFDSPEEGEEVDIHGDELKPGRKLDSTDAHCTQAPLACTTQSQELLIKK
jgi:hypothetical protein